MIINCGKRRICSHKYGWRVDKETLVKKKNGTEVMKWAEDRPAHPATLSQAFNMIADRTLKDMGELDISEVPQACLLAQEKVNEYLRNVDNNLWTQTQ